jgi:endonuclease/exonuclease/phosphatase family metal-dependent hydrolase
MARGTVTWRTWIAAPLLCTGLVLGLGGPTTAVETQPQAPVHRPPTTVHVSSRGARAVVTWDAADAPGYVVEFDTGAGFTSPHPVEASDGVAILEDLTPQTTYYVRVVPVGQDGSHGAASTPVSFTTSRAPFAYAARKLELSSQTSTSLTATWAEAAKDVRYEVQLATTSSFAHVRTHTVAEPTAVFDELETTTTYYLRARAISPISLPLSDWSPVVSGHPAASQPLRVASYNILKASADSWPRRRQAVTQTILSQDPDVIGIQEAENKRVPGGSTQYRALRALLGEDWALTTDSRHTTGEIRTLYNTSRLTLVDQGYRPLSGSRAFGGQRYVAWAIFIQKSTGKRFMFVNTHLVWQRSAKAAGARASQAKQLVRAVEQANPDDLPVVIGGDFNTHLHRTSGNAVYRTITASGYLDPLVPGDELGRAEKLVHANLQTYNAKKRKADDSSSVTRTTMVDHLFVSRMRVAEWETVAKLDSAGRFVGTIPSDHNMIRITVYLP